MSQKPKLLVDFCSYQAAKYAVEHWHYSKTMPAGKTVKIGVWEDDRFIGVVIYSLGNSKDAGVSFGLKNIEICELTRVALNEHETFVSKILANSLRLLACHCPGIRLVVSLADRNQDHHGGIYQASNWIYIGYQPSDKRLRPYKKNGLIYHWRTVSQKLLDNKLPCTVKGATKLGYSPGKYLPKHKYLYPLDKAMRRQIEPLAKPYPKRASDGLQPLRKEYSR